MRRLECHHPRSLDEAAEILIESLDDVERSALRAVRSEDQLSLLAKASLGTAIRSCWLSGGCRGGAEWSGPVDPDEACAHILVRAWKILRGC
jgi:hypothetical protein